jgi:hypothetical protein
MRLGAETHMTRVAGTCLEGAMCDRARWRIPCDGQASRSRTVNRHRTRVFAVVLAALSTLGSGAGHAQQLVVGASGDYFLAGAGPMLVFPDLSAHWNDLGVLLVHPTSVDGINPHAVLHVDREHVIATHPERNRADMVDLGQNSVSYSIFPAGTSDNSYQGFGSAAINPARSHVLLAPGSPANPAQRNKVWVMAMPLSAGAVADAVLTLPGALGTAQTRAIVFDPVTGRAYVGHSAGITAIDPPYRDANIAYTIDLPPVLNAQASIGRAIALSPDRQVLLSTATTDGRPLSIIHAPFSASSTAEDLFIATAVRLGAAAFTASGDQVLVVDNAISNDQFSAQFFAVNAPYSASSAVARMSIARHTSAAGFEDLAISPDGQFVALVGGSFEPEDRLVLARAPFTAAGFSCQAVRLPSVGPPYGSTGRGTGTATFWPEPLETLPQITINRANVSEGDAGLRTVTLTARLSHPASGTAQVDYATVDGTAIAGVDYLASQGTLQWPPGERETTIALSVIDNAIVDGNRTFRLQLATPFDARLLQPASGTDGEVQIIDDEAAAILTDSPLPDACLGRPYAVQFAASGLTGTLAWSVESLRGFLSGLTLDPQTGLLSGIPNSVDHGEFSILVRGDFPQFARRTYALVVRMNCDHVFGSGFE